MLLTDLLLLMAASATGIALFVWFAKLLGVHDGLHDLLDGLCPCDAAA